MGRIIIFLFLTIFCYANDIKDILNMIKVLNNQNFQYKEISSTYNPFNKTKQSNQQTKKKNNFVKHLPKTKTYHLEVIFQNKARINNLWYKNGDKIDNYTIIIKNNSVYLKNKTKLILLNRKTLLKVSK